GVDFTLYHPQAPEETLRAELGLKPGEKVVVFTGSNTFANEPEMRELYVAVALLNQRAIPTRLVRTGFNSPTFLAALPADVKQHVLDLGFVPKARLPRLLALADVLVQPGRPGPFNDYRLPSKLPEFLAMGKPVALPPTNLALLMQDGREAVFLHGGTPEDIAETCRRLFADPPRCAALGQQAAAFARRHFDLGANTRGLGEFYARVIAAPARADWALARDPFSSETALVMAQAERDALAPSTAVPLRAEIDLLARLTRQLDTEIQRLHGQPDLAVNQLEERVRVLAQHASNLQQQLDDTRRTSGQHIVNLDEILRLTRDHANNLEKVVADLRP